MCFKEDRAGAPPGTAQPTTGHSQDFMRIDAKVLKQIDIHIRSDFFWAFLYLGPSMWLLCLI